jgi:hypothetical protein
VKDLGYFVENARIDKGVADLRIDENFKSRIVTYFTFAINYRLGGLNVAGYHMTNTMIHVLNGILVYLLVLITIKAPFFGTSGPGHGSVVASRTAALFAALLFVL